MRLKTERLTIRHIVADDWKSVKDIWVDFNASQYAQYDKPHITDDADVQPRIAKWAAANSGTDHMFFAVCLDEIVIGYVAFNIRENGYEIGYCFHSAYHGKGYAKESHLALLDYLKTLGITRFSAGTAINNKPSVKLLTSLGFKLAAQEKVSFYKDAMGNDIVFDGGIFEMEYMHIQDLSKQYTVRALQPSDAEIIYEVLKNNTIFYKYHPPMVTVESIIEDMEALPPNKGYEDKHYIGFFYESTLVAVMDLIEHYPQYGTALLGFFAMNANLQGQGIGTEIISDCVAYLAQVGFKKVRLGIDKGNPQSKAFWLKNGFAFTGEEYESDGSTILVMERNLYG